MTAAIRVYIREPILPAASGLMPKCSILPRTRLRFTCARMLHCGPSQSQFEYSTVSSTRIEAITIKASSHASLITHVLPRNAIGPGEEIDHPLGLPLDHYLATFTNAGEIVHRRRASKPLLAICADLIRRQHEGLGPDDASHFVAPDAVHRYGEDRGGALFHDL